MNSFSRLVALMIVSLVTLSSCSKKVKEAPPPPVNNTPDESTGVQPPPATGVYSLADLDNDSCLRQRVIYFDFDQDTLKPEFQAIVACHAKYLRDRPSARLTLEGNTDERGSRAYNQALGERRANVVSSAMTASSAPSDGLTVVSYGEERPVCTDSNEQCWSQNRRVELNYTTK